MQSMHVKLILAENMLMGIPKNIKGIRIPTKWPEVEAEATGDPVPLQVLQDITDDQSKQKTRLRDPCLSPKLAHTGGL